MLCLTKESRGEGEIPDFTASLANRGTHLSLFGKDGYAGLHMLLSGSQQPDAGVEQSHRVQSEERLSQAKYGTANQLRSGGIMSRGDDN